MTEIEHPMKSQVREAALHSGPIIITGERWSGRTHAARRIHVLSGRTGKFEGVRLYRFPPELRWQLNPVLFGNIRRPSRKRKYEPGACERAHRGTLCVHGAHLLDEADQRYLIEFAATGRVDAANCDALGVVTYVRDARVVAVLRSSTSDGACTFVDALRGRPDTTEIHIPPLRDRPEEIARLFVELLRAEESDLVPSPEMVGQLREYPWPGNLQEMKLVAQHVARGGELTLPLRIRGWPPAVS